MELTLNKNTFINQLTKAFNFTNYNEVRYYLNGVLFEISDDKLIRMVATDGSKACAIGDNQNLIEKVHSSKCDYTAPEHQFIVCNKTVEKIIKLFKISKDNEQAIIINLNDKTIEITDYDLTIKGEIIDGNFPGYTRVIPQFLDKPSATFSSELFISLFKKIKNPKRTPYKLYITGENTASVLTNVDMTEIFVIMPCRF